MKFFIPDAKDKKMEDEVYAAIKKNPANNELGQVSNRRIWKLNFTHDGNKYYAEVGKPQQLTHEPVIAILYVPESQLYYVCTWTRGVYQGGPILVGKHSVMSYEDFEKE